MGIWGNMGDRLTGDLCKNLLGNLLNTIPGLNKLPVGDLPLKDLTQVNKLPNNVLQPVKNVPVLDGVLGGVMKSTSPPSKAQSTRRTTSRRGLFGGGGLPFDF